MVDVFADVVLSAGSFLNKPCKLNLSFFSVSRDPLIAAVVIIVSSLLLVLLLLLGVNEDVLFTLELNVEPLLDKLDGSWPWL